MRLIGQLAAVSLICTLVHSSVLGDDGIAFFEKHVRPVLIEHCYECHSAEGRTRAGLRLDTRDGWLIGGDSGTAILPGDPESSLIVRAIRHTDPDLEMPPKGKLAGHDIEALITWIKMGAPDPRTGEAPSPGRDGIDLAEGRQFWSFQPPAKTALPEVRDSSWPKTDIDRFMLASIEEHGLHPVRDAEPRELVRRIYYDLTGLPPTPEQMAAFLADRSEERFEKLVDELLDSPRFGEKWGRHWLDLARYSDSTGGGRSAILPNAWRYRNYVIDSFNRDKPYDQFIREQIAGDLLPFETPEQRAEQLIATGFLALGTKNLDLQDKEQLRMNTVDEQIDTFGRAFLSMTLGCARCHDHKFDPIPTEDYYALAGILRSTKTLVLANVSTLVEEELPIDPELSEANRRHREEVHSLRRRVSATKAAAEESDARDQLARLEKELKKLQANPPPLPPQAICVVDEKETSDYNVCVRGNVHQLGEKVPRGFLQVTFGETPSPPPIREDESGRRELADWIAAPDNPLTARVYVNRLWHHFFGAGLVGTVDNFGRQGTPPTHPELLNYLAVQFIEEGWSTKALIRRMALSRTYQLATEWNEASGSADPENHLRWRMPRRRLDAEALRDSLLLVSGALELRQIESSLPPDLQGQAALTRTRPDLRPFLDRPVRSIYLPVFREEGMNELFEVFDFANPAFSIGQRNVSNLPTQALYLMNNPFVMEQAARAAERLLQESSRSDAERVRLAYLKALGRPPQEDEMKIALDHLEESGLGGSNEAEAWARIFHALFASVDFRYLN